MVADQSTPKLKNQSGQTLIEVTFLLPILLMFVVILYKIMMATQMAIVNTQYARAQVYVLASNQPEYPVIKFSKLHAKMFKTANQDRMILGVADPKSLGQSTSEIAPDPQIQKIGRVGSTLKGSDERGEVKFRTEVRVRNTAAICTQLNDIPNGSNQRWPFSTEVCQYEGIK
jgi:hypothetical protein